MRFARSRCCISSDANRGSVQLWAWRFHFSTRPALLRRPTPPQNRPVGKRPFGVARCEFLDERRQLALVSPHIEQVAIVAISRAAEAPNVILRNFVPAGELSVQFLRAVREQHVTTDQGVAAPPVLQFLIPQEVGERYGRGDELSGVI